MSINNDYYPELLANVLEIHNCEPMKIVVTGGAGFIGTNLCQALLMQSWVSSVHIIDDFSTGSWENITALQKMVLNDSLIPGGQRNSIDLKHRTFEEHRLVVHEGSILDAKLLKDVLQGCSAVIHLAARSSVPKSLRDPMKTHTVNSSGTLQLLESIREINTQSNRKPIHVVLASSSSVYGSNPGIPKHEDLTPQPVSPYAVSKLSAESYGIAYQHSFGIPTLALRFFNVFGPFQPAGHAYAAVIPAFLHKTMHELPVDIYGDGTQTRDFTYVTSLVNILVYAVAFQVTYPTPVNAAWGNRYSLLDVLSIMETNLGKSITREFHEPRNGDVLHSQAQTRILQKLFGSISPVNFSDGLDETIRWWKLIET